jgi:hypothetical protein
MRTPVSMLLRRLLGEKRGRMQWPSQRMTSMLTALTRCAGSTVAPEVSAVGQTEHEKALSMHAFRRTQACWV